MAEWICKSCNASNEGEFDICWQCGTGHDGTPPDPAFSRSQETHHESLRVLQCLRCQSPMTLVGIKRFHEGSRLAPFLLGDLGELLVNRESFELYACSACGKVEFFLS
ncbi:hypothetical protein [Pseudoxanthomonas sp.]|uniref:hypothetical protein n=1 Tax=Pseudoxanthomonas sp. TaxID=1871049 RepID=UPI003F7E42CA